MARHIVEEIDTKSTGLLGGPLVPPSKKLPDGDVERGPRPV